MRNRPSSTDLSRTLFASRTRTMFEKLLLLAVAVLFCLVPRAWSQIDTATLVGTITDTAGAVVPNATVEVRDEATSLALQQKVSGHGVYTFTALKVGNYTITASAPGFEKAEQTHVTLAVQEREELEFDPQAG